MVFIVTFDLNNPGSNYDRLIELIKAESAWAKLGKSSYLVKSELKATQLRDNYNKVLGKNDKLYVGKVLAPAAWVSMPDDVSKWIKDNLSNE